MFDIMQVWISQLFAGSNPTSVGESTVLFRNGERVARIFLVTAGTVRLLRYTAAGAVLVLQKAGPGSVLAEASAYSDCYHCDAEAMTDMTLSGLPRDVFLEHLAKDSALAARWSATLAHCIQSARLRAEIRSLPKVAARLDAGNRLPEKGEWQDVAVELGITREALYRELAKRRYRGNRTGGGNEP